MLTRLFADNDEALKFSPDIPSPLQSIGFPNRSPMAAQTDAGHVLWLDIPCQGIHVRLHYYLLNRPCHFSCLTDKPELRLTFMLVNHLQCNLGSLGNSLLHEHGFNLLHLPDGESRLHFPAAGAYSIIDIHFPENALLKLQSGFPVMRNFLKRVQRKQAALLMPVHQVGSMPFTELMNQLVQSLHRSHEATWLRNRCIEVLAQCLNDLSGQPRLEPVMLPANEAPPIYHARTLLTEQYRHHWTMKKLAEQTGLNHYKLENGFWQLYQQSPSDYLRYIRMTKAWRLLPGNRYSVAQVAELVGYTNLSAFSKAFKKHFNITARQRTKEK